MIFQLKNDIYKFTNFDLEAKYFLTKNENWHHLKVQSSLLKMQI